MATPTYPTVIVRETDLTTRINTGDFTSFGALAINSEWGPAEEINLITSEVDLINYFGKPNSETYIDFFVASNFLTYSSSLKLVRVCDDIAINACSGTAVLVKNDTDYETATIDGSGAWIAKYPGEKGNSIFVACCDAGSSLSSNVHTSNNSFGTWEDYFSTIPGTSEHADSLGGGYDEMHVLVIDEGGLFTGVQGSILEKYEYLSKASNAKKEDGTNNFYKELLNQTSQYIRIGDEYVLGANSSALVSDTFSSFGNNAVSLTGGYNADSSNTSMYLNSYELFEDKKSVDVSHVIAGNLSGTSVKSLITMAETRGDCVVFISPEWSDVQVGLTQMQITNNIVDFKNSEIATSSSYYFVDGNWKQQYDKYNDVNRWIPCCGDTAGLKAKAEVENDSWWNGSGYNRGLIRNCIKLAWNPKDDYMGIIYKNRVNPIISEGGQFILLGDKTGLTRSSAFDRINVRYLFNTLKKKIGDYLKYGLFNFNDEFTRTQLTAQVESYLKAVKSRRGVEDFEVVCDLSNNTGIVRDNNELKMDVYIKPSKSINWITLTMVAVGSSVEFSEVVGRA